MVYFSSLQSWCANVAWHYFWFASSCKKVSKLLWLHLFLAYPCSVSQCGLFFSSCLYQSQLSELQFGLDGLDDSACFCKLYFNRLDNVELGNSDLYLAVVVGLWSRAKNLLFTCASITGCSGPSLVVLCKSNCNADSQYCENEYFHFVLLRVLNLCNTTLNRLGNSWRVKK